MSVLGDNDAFATVRGLRVSWVIDTRNTIIDLFQYFHTLYELCICIQLVKHI